VEDGSAFCLDVDGEDGLAAVREWIREAEDRAA